MKKKDSCIIIANEISKNLCNTTYINSCRLTIWITHKYRLQTETSSKVKRDSSASKYEENNIINYCLLMNVPLNIFIFYILEYVNSLIGSCDG